MTGTNHFLLSTLSLGQKDLIQRLDTFKKINLGILDVLIETIVPLRVDVLTILYKDFMTVRRQDTLCNLGAQDFPPRPHTSKIANLKTNKYPEFES